ncbi:hypothetical protein [Erythrobacter sp. JK5]|uniref:hypothetical protein n=1 Tax=Erythrobacter sp. JK5 TaxID=2829500 RepID=UPI001BAD7C49|nr:hypothetical protein [Erythrobacter sp. JK5]QUL38791.1 hypothetical protein KDC96_05315 [Erythrobacter sp. JK5]
MTGLPEQFLEDRALRDAARQVLMADLAHAKASLSGKSIANRVGSRVGDGAKDVFEVARTHAEDNRGILAALIGAIVLFFAREPIFEILGIAKPDGDDDMSGDETEQEGADPAPPPPPNPTETTMTDNLPATASEKRDELRAKIEASERRIAQRTLADQAREAASAATEYTRQHPFTVLGGAIAVGVVIGLMTKPGRRAVTRAATGTVSAVGGAASGAAKSVGGAARARGAAIGTLFTDAIVAYGMRLIDDVLDTARSGQDRIEDLGDSAAAKSREMKREAGYMAGTAADKSRTIARRTRRRAERAVRGIKDRVAN